MKWSILGLSLLGTIAAACAVVLVLSLQTSAGPAPTAAGPAPKLSVLVSTKDLPPRHVVTADDLEPREVNALDAPRGTKSEPVQVIGRVLVTPMTAGQPFLDTSFASEGSGLHLASALQPGRRAVSVSLSDNLGMENLLYPGAIVDVLTTIEVEDEPGQGKKQISVTILESVFVLAVGNRTIVSPEDDTPGGPGRMSRPTVTLLVDAEQAERLKLAMENGSVSLSLRNPSDPTPTETKGARLASLAPIFAEIERRKRERMDQQKTDEAAKREQEWEKREYEMEQARYAIERAREEIEIARKEYEREKHEASKLTEEETSPEWTTVILKGGEAELKVFKLPKEEAKKEDE